MTFTYQDWPFQESTNRSAEEQERWWKECYLAPPGLDLLASHPLWTILTGARGSGKSTTLQALQRKLAETHAALVVEYPPEAWPTDRGAHFERLAGRIAEALRDHFTQNETDLLALTPDQKQFLRWLIEKHRRPRGYTIWRGALSPEAASALEGVAYEDLYPSFEESEDISEFLFELLTFCRKIRLNQVVALVDGLTALDALQIESLNQLYAWMAPMHHPGFRVITALTPEIAACIRFQGQVKQRISFQLQADDPDWLAELAGRAVCAASGGALNGLAELFDPEAATDFIEWLKVEFATQTPINWLKGLQAALECAQDASLPFKKEDLTAVKVQFCLKHAPVRPGEWKGQKGVWRGERFLHLNANEFYYFEKLYQRQGKPQELDKKNSTYQSISRLRDAIEPDPEHPIYVKVSKNEGYRLENFVPQ